MIYVAAPLSAPTPTLRRWHRDRALLFARLLLGQVADDPERVCIPHRDLAPRFAPRWIEDGETPAQRIVAMRECLRLAAAADRLAILLLPGGDLSPGCIAERDAWTAAHPTGAGLTLWTWAGLRGRAVFGELGGEWTRLCAPPPIVAEVF